MDIKFLVPTILSIISICFTIIGIKRLSLFQNWQVYFEENKEKIRQQEKITDNIFNKLNSRAGLIPYFNIILDDSKRICNKCWNMSNRRKKGSYS